MADTKISALTDGTTANSTDQVPIARGGSNFYVTPEYLMKGTTKYGVMSVEGGAVAESTVDATPRQITAWVTNGASNGTTPDQANDHITIDTAGVYLVIACVSFSGSASKTFRIEIYLDTTGTNFSCIRKLGSGGDVGSASVMGLVTCTASQEISVYQSSTDGGTAMTVSDASLAVVRIGS